VKATVLSLLSCISMMLNSQRQRIYKFRLFPLSEPYNHLSWWTNFVTTKIHITFHSDWVLLVRKWTRVLIEVSTPLRPDKSTPVHEIKAGGIHLKLGIYFNPQSIGILLLLDKKRNSSLESTLLAGSCELVLRISSETKKTFKLSHNLNKDFK